MTTPLDLDKAVLGKNDLTHNTYTQSWLGNFQEYIRNASLQHISIWEWYCVSAWDASWEYLPWVQGNVATRNQALWKQNGVEYVFTIKGHGRATMRRRRAIPSAGRSGSWRPRDVGRQPHR